MIEIQRYIPILAIQTKDNKLIPFWDENIQFEKNSDYGSTVVLKNSWVGRIYQFTECIYDLKTKEVLIGVELNHYPDKDKLSYKIGQTIFYKTERSGKNELTELTIDDIIFEDYELRICKGKKLDEYEKRFFPDVVFETDTLYAIKSWEATYVLSNGKKENYDMYFYNIIK